MSDPDSPIAPAPSGTRAALIAAALRRFGRQGYEATSIRSIASEADANVAAIAYHFGGKEGLRRACAEAVADRMAGIVGAPRPVTDLTTDQAEARIYAMLDALVAFIADDAASGPVLSFVLREMGEDGPGLARLYETLFEPKHRELCALWSVVTGQPAETEGTRLMVFTMIGQLVYFRIGRPLALRRMGWTAIGPAEAATLRGVLRGNLAALIAAARERSQS